MDGGLRQRRMSEERQRSLAQFSGDRQPLYRRQATGDERLLAVDLAATTCRYSEPRVAQLLADAVAIPARLERFWPHVGVVAVVAVPVAVRGAWRAQRRHVVEVLGPQPRVVPALHDRR